MIEAHGSHPPIWRHWRTMEGGGLFDLQALRETATDPEEAARSATAQRSREESRAEIERLFVAALDSDVGECPHGRPLLVDLALPDGDADLAGLGLRLLAGPTMGSGRSPWTRAAIKALSRELRAGDVAADVGTGTGILGLHALQLGASRVDGVDSDPIAAAVARRNARANGLGDRFTGRHGSSEALGTDYDLAIVSISAVWDVAPVVRALIERIRPGGTLIASPAEGTAECDQLELSLRDLGLSPRRAYEAEGWFVWSASRAA